MGIKKQLLKRSPEELEPFFYLEEPEPQKYGFSQFLLTNLI
jgi:hypothetical protein